MTTFFVVQVVLLWVYWTWQFGRRAGIGLGIWLGITYLLAHDGWLRFGPLPPPLFFLLLPAVIATILLARKVSVRHEGLGWPIGYQSFRILVEIFLWWGHREAVVPVQLTFEGRNFDIVTGLTAPLVAWLPVPRWGVHAWNFMGLALLINVVTVAILSMPTPLQRFEHANVFVIQAPYVWLPLFLVPSALFGHVALWRRLTAR